MKVWGINREVTGKFLPIVDGAKPNYGGFDFRMSRVDSEEVEIIAGCEEAVRWLPSLRKGIEEYCRAMQEENERFYGFKIEITKIYSHDLDTTDEVMKYRGGMFLHSMKSSRDAGSPVLALEERCS